MCVYIDFDHLLWLFFSYTQLRNQLEKCVPVLVINIPIFAQKKKKEEINKTINENQINFGLQL